MTSPARPTRQSLLEELSRYARSHLYSPDEAVTLARFHHFVAHEPQCFERSHSFGHVTGSAWVVNAEGNAVVLLHHKKLGLWLQPGGHADGDPDIRGVAHRELSEETGLAECTVVGEGIFDIDIHAIPARPRSANQSSPPDGVHFHFDVRYAFQASPGTELVVSHESHAVRWFPLTEVPRVTSEVAILRMLHKWQRVVAKEVSP